MQLAGALRDQQGGGGILGVWDWILQEYRHTGLVTLQTSFLTAPLISLPAAAGLLELLGKETTAL